MNWKFMNAKWSVKPLAAVFLLLLLVQPQWVRGGGGTVGA
jgi:hypothetical protein